jgi:hypothetical protein
MNLRPPPQRTGNDKEDLDAMFAWAEEQYEFLKYPAFHVLRMVPRSAPSDTSEGNIYMDSTSHLLMCRDDDSWEEVGDMT